MEPIYNLYINNHRAELISHQLTREVSAIGRGFLTIKADNWTPKPMQIVQFDCGYKGNTLRRWFTGIVQAVTPQGKNVFSFKVRELTGVLLVKMPLIVRHVSLESLMSLIAQKSGLRFVHSKAEYWKKESPFFYSIGSGRDALNQISSVFDIPNFCWHQLADGSVFVGLKSESPASEQIFNIDFSITTPLSTDRAWSIPLESSLMPLAKINNYEINAITIENNKMILKCITN
ncbi:hypothetical protein ACU6U9_02395 [Pseudomonas sp. HK3]